MQCINKVLFIVQLIVTFYIIEYESLADDLELTTAYKTHMSPYLILRSII